MPKVIIINNVNIDDYYKMTEEYLRQKYHTHPTEIPDWANNPRPEDGRHSDLNNWAQRQGGRGDGKTVR